MMVYAPPPAPARKNACAHPRYQSPVLCVHAQVTQKDWEQVRKTLRFLFQGELPPIDMPPQRRSRLRNARLARVFDYIFKNIFFLNNFSSPYKKITANAMLAATLILGAPAPIMNVRFSRLKFSPSKMVHTPPPPPPPLSFFFLCGQSNAIVQFGVPSCATHRA